MTKTSKTSKAATTLEVKANDETNGAQDETQNASESTTNETKEVAEPINRLEVVRQLPEVDPDVKTKQAQGGIQHFKDVDDRTMNVVIHKGELYKQEHKGDDNE